MPSKHGSMGGWEFRKLVIYEKNECYILWKHQNLWEITSFVHRFRELHLGCKQPSYLANYAPVRGKGVVEVVAAVQLSRLSAGATGGAGGEAAAAPGSRNPGCAPTRLHATRLYLSQFIRWRTTLATLQRVGGFSVRIYFVFNIKMFECLRHSAFH